MLHKIVAELQEETTLLKERISILESNNITDKEVNKVNKQCPTYLQKRETYLKRKSNDSTCDESDIGTSMDHPKVINSLSPRHRGKQRGKEWDEENRVEDRREEMTDEGMEIERIESQEKEEEDSERYQKEYPPLPQRRPREFKRTDIKIISNVQIKSPSEKVSLILPPSNLPPLQARE